MNRNDVHQTLAAHRTELCDRFGVKSLALFGSVARDESTPASDVDLLVEFDRPITLFDLVALSSWSHAARSLLLWRAIVGREPLVLHHPGREASLCYVTQSFS